MRTLIIASFAVALGACNGEQATDDAAAENEANLAIVAENESAPPPQPGPTLPTESSNAAEPAAEAIPAALRGRWGLVAEDCTSTRGDAKGLLTILDTELRFYESRGTLDDVIESDANRIVADFDFMGEGQTWRQRMTLTAEDGGATLVRRESGDDAMPGALRYAKCEA